MNLDFSFLSWSVVQSFVLKGLIFSFQLTLIAMVGGIILGTLLVLGAKPGTAGPNKYGPAPAPNAPVPSA